MKFNISVIICSFENSGRMERLLLVINEVKKQINVNIEIILVWKGFDITLIPSMLDVKVVHVNLCSSSEARNIGFAHSQYEYICFLDDDTFPKDKDFLFRAATFCLEQELDFITCNIFSSGNILSGSHIEQDIILNKSTLSANMWEPGLFIRRDVFEAVMFDSTLGISCIHGSSEGFDFGLRLIAEGFKGKRIASLEIDHPPIEFGDNRFEDRTFFYSLGNGSVLIQHHLYLTYVWQIIKTVIKFMMALVRWDRLRMRFAMIRILSLLLGPLIPRQEARVLPRQPKKSNRMES